MLDAISGSLKGRIAAAWRMWARDRRVLVSRIPNRARIVLAVFFAAAVIGGAAYSPFLRHGESKSDPLAGSRRAQTAHVDALVKEILDRPLFSSDRSPAPEAPSPRELAALQPPVLKSHLTGITVFPGTRLAIFVSDGNKYRSVQEGEDVDGFKVRSIAPDLVILGSSFGEQVVRPAKGSYETVRNTKPVELGNFDPDR